MRRWIALLLVFALLPIGGISAAEEAPRLITEADYAAVDTLWETLEKVEERAVRARLSRSEAVASAVQESGLYREDTLRWQGEDHFTFETTVGVTCAWSARIEELAQKAEPWAGEETPSYECISYGSSNTASAVDVYVFQPYYGIDSSFTKQYQTEGQTIAEAMGGTYHLYTKNEATIDAVADAMEQGAVVIFDSHGDTDYARGEDYTTGATTSYLLLQTGTGLTDEDYAYDNGTYHAYYYGRYQGMYYYAVDGTCIANHMDSPAQGAMLWMAICLSMATDGLHAPLMEQGVAVAYGYSQSVTFGGDYCWEGCFWDEMCNGATVKDAVAKMKETYGCWDYSAQIYAANGWTRDQYYCANLSQAKQKRAAFPIVVSAEDPYPGHGKVDDLQTVNSTWTLLGSVPYIFTVRSNDESLGTVSLEGNVITAKPAEHAYLSGWTLEPADAAVVEQNGLQLTVSQLVDNCCITVEFREKIPAEILFSVPEGCTMENLVGYIGGLLTLTAPAGMPVADAHDYQFLGWALAPVDDTLSAPEYLTDSYVPETETSTLYALYTYTEEEKLYYTTELKVKPCPSEPFTDVDPDAWYHEAVDFALETGIMKGVSSNRFEPEEELTRAMLATILYRLSGEPEGGSHLFTDVPDGQWYSEAVAWAYENQVVNGIDAYTFAPDEAVTRQQAAAMLYRYARLLGQDVTASGDLSEFKDAGLVDEYARLPLSWAVDAGIINGIGKGLLDPEGTATRAQIAKIIYEWMELS